MFIFLDITIIPIPKTANIATPIPPVTGKSISLEFCTTTAVLCVVFPTFTSTGVFNNLYVFSTSCSPSVSLYVGACVSTNQYETSDPSSAYASPFIVASPLASVVTSISSPSVPFTKVPASAFALLVATLNFAPSSFTLVSALSTFSIAIAPV